MFSVTLNTVTPVLTFNVSGFFKLYGSTCFKMYSLCDAPKEFYKERCLHMECTIMSTFKNQSHTGQHYPRLLEGFWITLSSRSLAINNKAEVSVLAKQACLNVNAPISLRCLQDFSLFEVRHHIKPLFPLE